MNLIDRQDRMLVPALLILTAGFLFHQQGKRQKAKARAEFLVLLPETAPEAAKDQGRNCVRLSIESAVA
jgi:hypothetical protein